MEDMNRVEVRRGRKARGLNTKEGKGSEDWERKRTPDRRGWGENCGTKCCKRILCSEESWRKRESNGIKRSP